MQAVWPSIVLLERKARFILMHEIDNFSVTKIVSLHLTAFNVPTITPSTKRRFVLRGTIPSKTITLVPPHQSCCRTLQSTIIWPGK